MGPELSTSQLPVREMCGEATGAQAARVVQQRKSSVRSGDDAEIYLQPRPHMYNISNELLKLLY